MTFNNDITINVIIYDNMVIILKLTCILIRGKYMGLLVYLACEL